MDTIKSKSAQYTQKFQNEIEQIFYNPEKFRNWVTVNLNFRNYSFYNRCLISLQAPDSTYVATYKQWAKLGFKVVQKGGIKLARPNYIKGFYRDKDFISLKKATDQEKDAISKGTIKLSQIMRGFSYFTVFDISKTNATEKDMTNLITEKFTPNDTLLNALLYAYNKTLDSQLSAFKQIENILDERISELLNDSGLSLSQIHLVKKGVFFGLLTAFNEDTTSVKMTSQEELKTEFPDFKIFSKNLSSTLETVFEDIIAYC